MNAGLTIAKAVTLGVWFWAIGGAIGMPVPAADIAPMVAVGLAVAHTIEIAVFLPRLKDDAGSTASHAANIFIFGMFHYRSVVSGR